MTDARVRAEEAPAPDDEAKPDSPGDLDKTSWRYVAAQDRARVLQRSVHRPGGGPDVLLRAGDLPGADRVLPWSGSSARAPKTVDDVLKIMSRTSAASPSASILRADADQLASTPGAGLALVIGLAGGPVVGVRLRRRVRPGDEPDLRDRRGPAVLEAPAGDAAGHRWSRSCWPRSSSLALVVTGPVRQRSATRSGSAPRWSRSGTSPSGRCCSPS